MNLRGVKAAQTHIIPQLGAVDTHLQHCNGESASEHMHEADIDAGVGAYTYLLQDRTWTCANRWKYCKATSGWSE